MNGPAYVSLAEYFPTEMWPIDLFTPVDTQFLEAIAYIDGTVGSDEAEGILHADVMLQVMRETVLELPAGLAIVLGSGDVAVTLDADPDGWQIRLATEVVKLRLPSALFRPVIESDGRLEPDPDLTHAVDIPIPFAVTVDHEANLDVEWPEDRRSLLDLPPCMIGDSGVIIEARGAVLRLSGAVDLPLGAYEVGLDDEWRGLFFAEAAIHLPEGLGDAVPSEVRFVGCYIGSGGFTGTALADWAPPIGGNLFGMQFTLAHFGLSFAQSVLTGANIRGRIRLPFFDEPLDITIGLKLGGGFTVSVVAAGDAGLPRLEKPGVFRLTLDGVGFDVERRTFAVRLSGQLKPLIGSPGLDWPTFQVKELTIDSKGNVRLEGGWLDLREQYALDFHGFQMEITKLGFGRTDDGGKWIGFSGGLKLLEGLPAGASVEGLRLTWYEDGSGREPKLTFNGVGVELEVPDVLSFKGAVSYVSEPPMVISLPDGTQERVERFDGAIKLNLQSLDMHVDGTLVVGSASGPRGNYNFFAVYLAAELPAGIPIFSTGLALYGMAGLFALQMEPNKGPQEGWYENPDGTPGWYKRDAPGVTDLTKKWAPTPGSLAFGAGVTIGTLSDNGRNFHGRLVLVLVFPGPIILLEGRGDLLKERAALDEPSSEPIFRALAVLDKRAGNLTVGLDAQYKYREQGELIDIRAGAEAFFDFRNADAWHIYLGEKEPREKRIRARAFNLFESNAYFMLDAHRLAIGAWVGYDKRWKFGPLRVALQAWIEGNAVLSLKPTQFHGDLWLHGKAELRAFGIGVGLTADAQITADVFEPFHLLGKFRVKVKTPWPLPDPSATVTLEWGPKRTRPPLSLPLKEIAVEHLKVTTSWPLPRGRLLLPNFDSNGDGFLDGPTGATEPADLTKVPTVPLDARPHITFGRHVNDDARVGVNVQSDVWERIGDPASGQGPLLVRYGLQEVELAKLVASGADRWPPVALKRKGITTNPAGVRELYGSWAPVPPLSETAAPPPETGPPRNESAGQTKLWLWSKTPFDYSRHSGRVWDEWFTDRFGEYPCVTSGPGQEGCCRFESLDLQVNLPYTFPDGSGVVLERPHPETRPIKVLNSPVVELSRALCMPYEFVGDNSYSISIKLAEPAEAVRITRADSGPVAAFAHDVNEVPLKSLEDRVGTTQTLEISAAGISRVKIGKPKPIIIELAEAAEQGLDGFCLVQVCVKRHGAWSCYDWGKLAVPWHCDQHPEIVFDSPPVPNTFGRITERELREPVDGLVRALCFDRKDIPIP